MMKVNLLGTQISKADLEQTITAFSEFIDDNQKKRICVLPVNCVLWAYKDKYLRDIYNSSDMNLADGVPLIWASKFMKDRIEGRVTGLDLLPRFSKVASEKGYSFFFLGAKEGVAENLAKKLKAQYPDLKISGYYSPPFADKFSDEENKKIIAMINNVKPDVLWVSLTAPKQDIWIYEHIANLDVNIAIGVGGAFEVTAGLIRRAPVWMQKRGLEWLFRLLQEPKRLFRRYIVEAPRFIPLIFLQKIGAIKDIN